MHFRHRHLTANSSCSIVNGHVKLQSLGERRGGGYRHGLVLLNWQKVGSDEDAVDNLLDCVLRHIVGDPKDHTEGFVIVHAQGMVTPATPASLGSVVPYRSCRAAVLSAQAGSVGRTPGGVENKHATAT